MSSPEIPDAEVLLHADCNQQEVLCELSQYTPQGAQWSSDSAYLMVSLDVEGVDFSAMIILQTVKTEDTGLVQTNLGLPLSQSGMLLTDGETSLHLGRIIVFTLFFCFFLMSLNLVRAPQWSSWCSLPSKLWRRCSEATSSSTVASSSKKNPLHRKSAWNGACSTGAKGTGCSQWRPG